MYTTPIQILDSSPTTKSRTYAAILAALSVFALFTHLGGGSLASWDEAIYSSVAREMLQTGDWIRLRYAGGGWFDKPPLAMWATALFYTLFGVSEFSSRLFASLCGVGTVLATYELGRRLWGSWAGFCGASCLVSAGFFMTTARFATLDSPLTFFLTLTLLFFWLGRERPVWFWASGAALGLAIMTKGFAAILFFPAVFVYALCAGEIRFLVKKEFLGALGLAFLIALPWHLFQILEFPEAFWRDVVVRHLFSRTTQAVEGHQGGLFFYVRVLLNKFRPAIFLGAGAIPWFLWQAFRRRDKAFLFVASWALTGFLLATTVRTKLSWYIYPILPPLSLMTGYALARLVRPRFLVLVTAVAAVAIASHGFHSHRFSQDYSRPIKALAERVRRDVPVGGRVYLIRYHEDPAVTFYWQRPVADLDEAGELEAALKKSAFYGLVRQQDYELFKSIFEGAGTKILDQFEGFYWVWAPPPVV